ncbi:unnamed protein product [Medioppia subpectinata]|uniref:Uncharacterized protein n=1 Tax=Medioppia subpectinata TaxID=1979941 RepID=A0A7R9Q5Y8_9ACAR|nr:unnamed protein product [Medioppia subpectinata]CAG2114241.1 unnamed protein product [Medioppia subpectinata]
MFSVYRQKCVNWCQLVANRRHFTDDSDKDNDKSVTIKEDSVVDNASHKRDSTEDDGRRKSDDKVVVAKHNLNELIQTLKSKDIFGKPDDKLREVLAKPVFHIKKSARKEVPIEDTIKEDINE